MLDRCQRCGSDRLVSLSIYGDRPPERLCVEHRRAAGRELLAGLCAEVGRVHTAARLRGTWCSGPCAACDAERRAA